MAYYFYLSFLLTFINFAIQQRYDVIKVIEVPRPVNNFQYQQPQGNQYVMPNQYPPRYPVHQNNQPNYNGPQYGTPKKNEYTIYAIEVPTNVLFGKNNVNSINNGYLQNQEFTPLIINTPLTTITTNATKEKKKKSRRRKKPKPKTTTETNDFEKDDKEDNEYEYYDIDIRSFNTKKTSSSKEIDNDKLPIWTT